MKTAKTASMILGGLLLLLALPAQAQHLDWRRVTADASAARKTGNNTGAATLYKQALEIQEKTFGPKSREAATSLHNLAVLYQDESKDAEAEPLYRRSIAIWGQYPGTDSLIAASLSNLAALCHDEHKDEEAEQLFNRSLAIWKKMGQLESLGAAATLASLGDIYNSEGKYTQAEPLYNHALAIWEKPVNWKTPMRSPLLLG